MTKIIVDCELNDTVDIRCGGPNILGFDFFVKNEDTEKAIQHIKKFLKKYKRPLMSMRTIEITENKEKYKIWNLQEIQECIKEGY